jgi:hypothetical protein
MALIMDIMKTIASPIGELARWLEETYQVDVNETTTKWRELTGMNITVTEDEVSHDELQSVTVDSSTTKKSKKIPKTKDVCQHIFLSGQKIGDQCSTKPKGGASYCSAHRPKDSVKKVVKKEVKKKEVKPVDKINSVYDTETEEDEKPVKKSSKKEEKVVVPKKPKKTSGDTDLEESDIEALSEPETIKPLLKKKKNVKKPSKKAYDTDEENLDKDLDLSD